MSFLNASTSLLSASAVDTGVASFGAHTHQAMLGLPEMLVILAIVVVLFGATKLPQLGKGMGEAIGNFKKAQRDSMNEANEEVDATPKLESDRGESVPTDFEKKGSHAS